MGMVPVGLEGVKSGIVAGAHVLEGFSQAVGHLLGHNPPAVLGSEHDVGVELVDHMAAGAELIYSHMAMIHTDQSIRGRLCPCS